MGGGGGGEKSLAGMLPQKNKETLFSWWQELTKKGLWKTISIYLIQSSLVKMY